ncbi:hypothetical protein [Stackebrandtia soli]|uniref:hypothetical protein n=1 Tax=Stackebrandtia soli TaxID=1892856 RepID=UPI0039EC3456
MQDAWREYLELALGVTEASRRRAADVVRTIAEQSGAKISDLQGMAEELVTTGMANREGLAKLVRFELDRALGKVGLATGDEVAELAARVQRLESELRQAKAKAAESEKSDEAPTKQPVKKTVKKAAAKKTVKKTVKKAAKKTVKKTTKPETA